MTESKIIGIEWRVQIVTEKRHKELKKIAQVRYRRQRQHNINVIDVTEAEISTSEKEKIQTQYRKFSLIKCVRLQI